MSINHTPADIERMKEKAYDLLYRMYVCRLVTNQAMEMHRLFCNKERFDKPIVTEIEGCQKLLNKVWMKLREKEDLLFQEMIDLDFTSPEIQSVMSYAEPKYTDDYAIMETYGIVIRNFEETERRINSLRY